LNIFQGYTSLYNGFENFYTRHIYGRMIDCWNHPICSVPGSNVTLLERKPANSGQLEMTGKKLPCINMGSYNYLGFADNHGQCAQAALNAINTFGVGTCGSRKELGWFPHLKQLEEMVARFVGTEDAITCAMGFATNALNIPAIVGKGCLVLSDEKNHASIITGLKVSGATVRLFKHNGKLIIFNDFVYER